MVRVGWGPAGAQAAFDEAVRPEREAYNAFVAEAVYALLRGSAV